MHLRLPALLLVAATPLVTGCGGGTTKPLGEAKSVGATQSLSVSQFIGRADAICARRNAEFSAANTTARNPQDIVSIVAQRAPAEQATVIELSKLGPPSSLAHDWRLIIAYRRMMVEDILKIGQAASGNDSQGVGVGPVLASVGSLQKQMFATAKRDGFKACSQAS
jgi:hypothetical protein